MNKILHQSPPGLFSMYRCQNLSPVSLHIIMIVQVTHRSWKNLKICFFLILALILLKFIFHYGRFKRHKTRKIPLLEQVGKNGSQRLHLKIFNFHTNYIKIQNVNKKFNSKRVWVSMSFCYTASLHRKANRRSVISAVLSARLYRIQSGMVN